VAPCVSQVLCAPAFIRAGNAVADLLRADRFLLGGDPSAGKAIEKVLRAPSVARHAVCSTPAWHTYQVTSLFHWAKDNMICTNLW
jgi:UDP-glucose 6-dehydrogenase